MQQIWISKAGEPEVLKVATTLDPTPQSGEVRIRVEACGINFADILGRMGIYPDAPKIPYVPGYEVAGTIDSIGQGVPGFKEGDRVFAATRFGGYSDVVCVPHKQVFPRWEWMSVEDAAALTVNYLTAYMMLVVMGSLRPGDKVLIHGAAGGVGLAALDVCKILGAETYGAASPDKHEFLLNRGLDYAIDYRNRDFVQAIMDLTGGNGVHIVLDPIGGRNWIRNYRLLRPTGRLLYFGYSQAAPGKRRSWFALLRLLTQTPLYTPYKLMNDNKGVMGVNLAHLWDQVDMLRHWMAQILNWYDEALFRPHVDRNFKFSQAAEAHHHLQDRRNIGKVLLHP